MSARSGWSTALLEPGGVMAEWWDGASAIECLRAAIIDDVEPFRTSALHLRRLVERAVELPVDLGGFQLAWRVRHWGAVEEVVRWLTEELEVPAAVPVPAFPVPAFPVPAFPVSPLTRPAVSPAVRLIAPSTPQSTPPANADTDADADADAGAAALAVELLDACERFETVVARIGRSIRFAVWSGPAAATARFEWDARHSARLTCALADVITAAQTLSRPGGAMSSGRISPGGGGAASSATG